MAVGKKTGGRQKGALNKRTVMERSAMAASGELPLEYMLRVMRDPSAEHDRRDDMAKAAAKFCHPALAAIEHTGKDGGAIETADVTDQKRLAAVALMAARAVKAESA